MSVSQSIPCFDVCRPITSCAVSFSDLSPAAAPLSVVLHQLAGSGTELSVHSVAVPPVPGPVAAVDGPAGPLEYAFSCRNEDASTRPARIRLGAANESLADTLGAANEAFGSPVTYRIPRSAGPNSLVSQHKEEGARPLYVFAAIPRKYIERSQNARPEFVT